MKVIFAGPSLHGVVVNGRIPGMEHLVVHGPARQGDLSRAVQDGAAVIGLIDGRFGDVPAVWHKEILMALDAGVAVYGAASMGALRAAECTPFGMIGIGEIYRAYRSGALIDDDAVAQLHAPPEFGFAPLTEALVNVERTLDTCSRSHLLTEELVDELRSIARRLHFTERSWDTIVDRAVIATDKADHIQGMISQVSCNQKQADALEMLRVMATYFENLGSS